MAASVVNKDMQYTGSGYSSHLNNKYDSAGKLTSVSIATDTSGYLHTNYIYNNTRLWKVQTNGNSAPDGTGQAYAVYGYYPDGKVKKITYPKLNDNSYLTTEYIYNKLNRLESVTNKKGTAVLSQYQYTYDANGNIETINDGQETVNYEYDKLNRLQEIQSPSRGTIQYTYDIRGNRKTMQTANPILYTSSASYSYDLRDRLKSAVKGTETTNISYRADGLRYSKTTGAQATQYHYNMAGKVVAESNTAGSFTAGYVWGPDRTLVRKDAGGEYYYLYNGHGDVVQLIDRNGNVANNYEYDEWGNVLEENETVDNPFKYAGEILDDETGLYYLKARYYDPIAGRFINEDKYEGTVTNPLSINVYSYANNNPILYVDPTGNISWRQFGTLFGGVVDGLLGLSDLKSLFNGEALQGMIQFGKSVLSGQVNFVDIAKSIGASFVQPFQYLAEHSKNVWTGTPKDQEVYEYGKCMGNAIQTIVGAVGGGGVVGAKIVEALGKVCPKLLKAVDKVANAIEGTPKTNPAGGGCFTAGTLVPTEDGQRPIEEIKVGDYVWSENPKTGEKGLKKVVNTFIHDKYTLIHVYTGDTMIETTEEHPFWVEDKGWMFAGELNEGDVLRLKSGENVKVEKLERVDLKEPVKVYNFEVQDWHTYYVSDINVLVHNKAMKYNGVNKAYDVLEEVQINGGAAPKGYAGNVEYRNQPNTKLGETKIPNKNIANYTEYDVNEFNGWNKRGTERLVTGDDGSAWYTPDHYKTWIQIK